MMPRPRRSLPSDPGSLGSQTAVSLSLKGEGDSDGRRNGEWRGRGGEKESVGDGRTDGGQVEISEGSTAAKLRRATPLGTCREGGHRLQGRLRVPAGGKLGESPPAPTQVGEE